MRILNGLKYTVVDQFKVLAMTLASVFVVFLGIIALFSSGSSVIRLEAYPMFIWLSFVLMVFMGISYTPIYFRTLVQSGVTRKEIFTIQIITDVVILLSGGVIVLLSIIPFFPKDVFKLLSIFNPQWDSVLTFTLSIIATRTLFNCFGLILNKFNSRFAGFAVVVTIYFLLGLFSRVTSNFEINRFLEQYGLIFSVLCLATLLVIEFFIIKTHNSKPITK